MPQKGSKCKISLQTKLRIIEAAQQQASYSSIMKEFDIRNKSTVAMILKSKEKYIAAAQKTSLDCHRISSLLRYPEVDDDIERFISDCVQSNRPINIEILRNEAKKYARIHGYANFPASNGYLEKFLKKKRSLDSAIATNAMREWTHKLLPQMLEGYSKDDVYNGDEFSLSYRNVPKKMGQSLGKQSCCNTEKVTVFVATNWSSSDKLQLVVIGKSKDPVCLKKKETPIIYCNSQTGRMTQKVFEEIMVMFNEHFRQQGRKVLFVVDMCDEHKVLTLSNLKVDFWPPAAAAKLQPLQHGIIPLLRENYQRLFAEKMLQLTKEGKAIGARKLNLLDTSFMLHSLWEQVEPDQIESAFLQAGFPDSNVLLSLIDVGYQVTCKSSVTAEDAPRVPDLYRRSFNVSVGNTSVEEEDGHSSMLVNGVPTTAPCKDNPVMNSVLVKDSLGRVDLIPGDENRCLSAIRFVDTMSVNFSALQMETLENGCPTEAGSLTLVEDVSSPLHSVTVTEEKAVEGAPKAEAATSVRKRLSTGRLVDTLETSLLTANIIEAVGNPSEQQSGTHSQTVFTGRGSREKVLDFLAAQKALHTVRGYLSSRGAPEDVLDMVSGLEAFLMLTQ